MKGDLQEKILVACVARAQSYASMENRFGKSSSSTIRHCLHNGYLCRIGRSGFCGTSAFFKTTQRGAEWVFAHREKKKKVEQDTESTK